MAFPACQYGMPESGQVRRPATDVLSTSLQRKSVFSDSRENIS